MLIRSKWLIVVLLLLGSTAGHAQSCPGTPGAYFVQCETAILPFNSGRALTKALDNPTAAGHKVAVILSIVQSLGNHAPDIVTVTDQVGNTYTNRWQQDGSSGNLTNVVFDATTAINTTLTVTATISGSDASLFGMNMSIIDYKNLGTFVAVKSCFSNNNGCATGTPFSTGTNIFYLVAAGYQGSDNAMFIGPVGYTNRTNFGNAGGTSGFLLGTWDNFLSAAQGPNYSVFVDNTNHPAVGAFNVGLLTYTTVNPSVVPRRTIIY